MGSGPASTNIVAGKNLRHGLEISDSVVPRLSLGPRIDSRAHFRYSLTS